MTTTWFKSGVFISIIFSVKSDYIRHRDNKLNKGTWVKNDNENLFDKSGFGDFIFKPNSVNVDDMFQDDFYGFGGNHVQDAPFVSKYIERTKRSPNILETGFRKGINNCKGKDCNTRNLVNNKPIIKSKFTPKHKTPSLLNIYPYDIAVLMNNVKNHNKVIEEPVSDAFDKSIETNSINLFEDASNQTQNASKPFEVIMANEIFVDDKDDNQNNITIPKRSSNKNYESEIIKKIEIIEDLNKTHKYDRNIFDEKVRPWPQNPPLTDVNIYKVIPKSEEHASVSEKGLIKLLTILTRTFKKIMKQHIEIKKIHSEMFAGKEDIDRSVSLLINKFNDFESKYSDIKDTNVKIQELQNKLEAKEEYFKNKETEMSHNLADFENQQKKFLTQQRQFYNIQKLMLAQNEKINAKQSMIAKTQSEISRRQNNFARILKKAQQVYIDKKPVAIKLLSKIADRNESETKSVVTAANPVTTESIKIDLFSIPSLETHLENQDKLILREKDNHPVDDLVYKYYFNNTFIDTLMRNHILSGPLLGNKYITRNIKTKRNEAKKIQSTILMPVANNTSEPKITENRRAKRWIRHHKGKLRRKHHKMTTTYEMKDEKLSHPNMISNLIDKNEKAVPTPTTDVNKIETINTQPSGVQNISPLKDFQIINPFMPLDKLASAVEQQLNPFMTMAANFCNQIGQNGNPLMLSWCVEKVLRRLQNIETIPVVATIQQTVPVSTSTPAVSTQTRTNTTTTSNDVTVTTSVTSPPSTAQMEKQNTTVPPIATIAMESPPPTLPAGFFPDNDELESNLKQYVLQPDEEGNVYYEGSLHASEMFGHGDSEGFSDIPGFDSNSKMEVDPITFDIQSQRRASIRRMNEKKGKRNLKKHRGIV